MPMKIKSARAFRAWYKTERKHISATDPSYNENYIGCVQHLGGNNYSKGLFEMFHGDKEDVGNFLGNFLKIAEDGQAIYEFLQNAADCGSTLFYLFYNENYFLAVNNGSAFTKAGLHSLLNVAQSTKEDSTQIGRFGIGFKLVHRLVGIGDGKDEIVKQYKGPVLFSWSKRDDLLALMRNEQIEPDSEIGDDSDLPYLAKLVLTNFPAEPNETVKDLHYQDNVLFPQSELDEMSDFINSQLSQYVETDDFNQGSLFFIRLGEGKKALLDADYEKNFKCGVEYSLNTLRNLKNVKVNGEKIDEVPLKLECGIVSKDSSEFKDISPEYKDADISFSVGYNRIDFNAEHPFVAVNALKDSPTFYKYFPLADEMHGSALFVHCDSFSNEANRRKLHNDNINNKLFPELAKFVIGRMDAYYAEGNVDGFNQMYANLLLSDAPHANSSWLTQAWYESLKKYMLTHIPTKDCIASDKKNVRICRVKSPIANDSNVLGNIHWFLWDEENVDELSKAAANTSKLDLSYCDIRDFVQLCSNEGLSNWVSKYSNTNEYLNMLAELSESASLSHIRSTLITRKLLAFSDGIVRTWQDVVSYDKYSDHLYARAYKNRNIVFSSSHTIGVTDILHKLGIVTSTVNTSEYHSLFGKCILGVPPEERVFATLSENLTNAELSSQEKRRVIVWLTDENNKLQGVGPESIKKLKLCRNTNGELRPLSDMISVKVQVPDWLRPYQISSDEYFDELDEFLIPNNRVYAEVIYPQWDNIIDNYEGDTKSFYETVKFFYDQDDTNCKNLTSLRYIRIEDGSFCKSDDVFYSKHIPTHESEYACLRNALASVFDLNVPQRQSLSFLEDAPFSTNNDQLEGYEPTDVEITKEDVVCLIDFCDNNRDRFFKSYTISKTESGNFSICVADDEHRQVYTKFNAMKAFINEHCEDFVVLPNEFSAYSDYEGILTNDALQEAILKSDIDVEEYADELFAVLNAEFCRKLLLKLTEIRLSVDKEYDKESVEYKLIKTALSLKDEDDIDAFRNKVIIESDGEDVPFDQIPSSVSESFPVDGALRDFNMSMLLPDENANSALLETLIGKLVALQLDKDDLEKLFGITNEPDLMDVFNQIEDNYSELVNVQQLAFVLQMHQNEGVNIDKFEVKTLSGNCYAIEKAPFYTENYAFIDDTYILDETFSDLGKYVELPIKEFYERPFVEEGDDVNTFVCPGIREDAEESARVVLLDFIHKLRLDGTDISKVDFNKFDDNSSESVLGGTFSSCICSDKYALEEEKLPDYVVEWLGEDKKKRKTLSDMSVLFEDSKIVKLRMYFCGDADDFNKDWLFDEQQCAPAELENTLKWVGQEEWKAKDQKQYDIVLEVINRINEDRSSRRRTEIKIEDVYDLETLEEASEEYEGENYGDWKSEVGYSLFLYEGEMPHKVTIDEYIESEIWRYTKSNYVTDGKDVIYVNSSKELQPTLFQLAGDEDENDINLETIHIYKLFDADIAKLKAELARKNNEIAILKQERESANIGAGSSSGLESEQMNEYSLVAKNNVRERLESEGFVFTQGIGEHSTIPGVVKDGIEYPLVVKSYRYLDEPMHINPNEWICLFKPNSMLWVDFGKGMVQPIRVRDLFDYHDKIVLSFGTENLAQDERLNKIMEVMRYFKNVHLDIASLAPDKHRGETLDSYLFNENRPENSDTSETNATDLL